MSSIMKLTALNRHQVDQAGKWRAEQRDVLRTPYFLTEEMQEKFYDDVVCNRNSPHRFYAINFLSYVIPGEQIPQFIGMGGLINIEWENSTAELSLITSPGRDDKEAMFDVLFNEAFNRLNLHSVYVETYLCGNIATSLSLISKYGAHNVILPERKFIDGKYYDSVWWMITRRMYERD